MTAPSPEPTRRDPPILKIVLLSGVLGMLAVAAWQLWLDWGFLVWLGSAGRFCL